MSVGIVLGILFGGLLSEFENYQASFHQRNPLIVPMTPFVEKVEYVVIHREVDRKVVHKPVAVEKVVYESVPVKQEIRLIEKKTVHEPAPITKEVVYEPAPIKEVIHESAPIEEFPPFGHARHPVSRVPNWGDMYTPEQWERNYKQMTESDFVPVPRYNLRVLTKPMNELLQNREIHIAAITAKLYYSTRFMGTYDLDAGEFSGKHPGVDLKLAKGTPVGAIGGGRVHSVSSDSNLGLHIIIEHRIPDEGTFYSIYGHLGSVFVEMDEEISSGQSIGTVGMTGKTTAPHVHLQVDRGAEEEYVRYWPKSTPSRSEALLNTVNPISFIANHR